MTRLRSLAALAALAAAWLAATGLAASWLAASWLAAPAAARDVPEAVLAAQQQRIEAIAKATRAAVSVFGRGGRGGGSGVVITADGYALTNYHVTRGAGDFMKCSMPDGRLYDAVIVGIDPTGDVAMIKLLGRDDFPAAELGDSDQCQVGDFCFAVGNPFLLATDFQPTVTYGIVSGVHRYQYPAGTLLEYADCIQTDASINPGNSGGPLFNARGELIGINGRGSFEKRGRVNVGVGYAISINQIKHFMGYLRSGRIVDHATLGANVSTDDLGRVIVSNILESSDAYRRGLRYGDELLAFGGREITTVNGFKNALGIFPRGWRVPISFRRDDQQYNVFVRLAGVHSPADLIAKVQRRPAPDPNRKPDDEDQDEPKKDEPKKDEPKKDEPKKDEPKKDEPDGEKQDGQNPDQRQPPRERPMPRPQPGRPQPGPRPRPGRPQPGRPGPAQTPVPPEVAKLLIPRRGYANYYFNQLHRDRVWQAFTKNHSFTDATGLWKLVGQMAGGAVEVELGESLVTGGFPVGPAKVELDTDLANQLGPAGSGGLLVALHCWKRLLQLGPEKFGEVYYLGTMPIPRREGQFDVLVGIYDVVECRFLFDPQSGDLVALELISDPGIDPCEVYFHDPQELGGHRLPARMEVRHGDALFGEIVWEQFQPGTPADEDAQ